MSQLSLNNKVPDDSQIAGGGGLAIEFTLCRLQTGKDCSPDKIPIQNAVYRIENSKFINNHVVEPDADKNSYFDRSDDYSQSSLGRGGGLFIALRGKTRDNTFIFQNCEFINNTASTWGGGMYLSIREDSSGTDIEISDCVFLDNICTTNGGGGLILAMISYDDSAAITHTSIEVTNSQFIGNAAMKHGGGMLLLSSRENRVNRSNNTITFTDCEWTRNRAALGSAADIAPSAWDVFGNGHLPTPRFINCSFKENVVDRAVYNISGAEGIRRVTERTGTLLISRFSVEFSGEVNITDNNSNGIFLQSGTLTIEPNSRIILCNNTAKKGGALVLYAFSVLFISVNTSILFKNNTAVISGGAIYVNSKDQHEKVSSKSCFFQKSYKEREDINNAFITFEGNVASSQHGNAIYASSLSPCDMSCFLNSIETQPSNCPAKIKGLLRDDVTTQLKGVKYIPIEMNLSKIIPGRLFQFPINATDELDATINVVYDTSLKNDSFVHFSENVTSLSYVSGQNLYLQHKNDVMEKNTLFLANKEITLEVDITVLKCPPGHVRDNETNQCTCRTSYFKGIWKCDAIKKIASINNGYWIGVCTDGKQCSGNCPVGLCNSNTSTELTSQINETHKIVCNGERKGKLCGKCTAHHSVYYHSNIFKCGKETYCDYGIVFYILSEIIPLTAIFIIIITLNISFTFGIVNGLILYAQIYDASIISYYNIEVFPKGITKLFQISKLLYATTNLNYFTIEEMSFCLWKGASTLDVIAWKYVTIVYALFLIIVTICILNTLTCKCVRWRPHTLKNAVIHGFTAFLVMSYSQCTKVSFQLLTYTKLLRYNFTESERVVLYGGEEAVFNGVHIKYAVPAIIFMLTIVILPPILLFLYPLIFKALALCRLSELKVINRISNMIPVQLFDSFQSCYKDNFRFFSGLYFFYRTVPLLLYAINTDLVLFYFSVEVFLILALMLHSLLQPYKETLHNRVDTLIFTNLAVINGISLYNYVKNNEGKGVSSKVKIAASIQLLLIYIPILCIIIYCAWYMVKKFCKGRRRSRIRQSRVTRDEETLLDSIYLPELREGNDFTASHEFHGMQ